MATTKRVSVARRQLIAAGVLTPKEFPLLRALRDAMSAMVRDVKPQLQHRWVFDRAGYPNEHCITDPLAIAIDDAIRAIKSRTDLTVADQREQALCLPRTLEAHIRASFVGGPTLSITEQLLRANRTDAAEDMTLAEAIAHPGDPSVQLRAADMMAHEAREKLSVADHIRAFFARTHRGSAA